MICLEDAARKAGPQGCAVEGEREAEKTEGGNGRGQVEEEAQVDEGEEDVGEEENGGRVADPTGMVEEEAEQWEKEAGDGVGYSDSNRREGRDHFIRLTGVCVSSERDVPHD